MKNVLITGGPVHAYLDDVKIITNRFKGGLMADLAEKMIDIGLHEGDLKYYVTYLSGKDVKKPPIWGNHRYGPDGHNAINLQFLEHDGFND